MFKPHCTGPLLVEHGEEDQHEYEVWDESVEWDESVRQWVQLLVQGGRACRSSWEAAKAGGNNAGAAPQS